MSAPIPTAPPLPDASTRAASLDDILTAEWARDLITTIGDTEPRSLQTSVGPSEVGQRCRRRLAYRLLGTPTININDPVKSLIGKGTHEFLAAGLHRLDPSRYLIEHPVTFRGMSGRCDAVDLRKHRAIDWKTSNVQRMRRYRAESGIPTNYRTQLSIYALGLREQGIRIDTCACVFVARDGDLRDLAAFTFEPDERLANEHMDEFDRLRAELEGGNPHPVSPGEIDPWPSPLCSYCPNFSATATNLDLACPGQALNPKEQPV